MTMTTSSKARREQTASVIEDKIKVPRPFMVIIEAGPSFVRAGTDVIDTGCNATGSAHYDAPPSTDMTAPGCESKQ